MEIYYLEIVTPDVEGNCRAYAGTHGVSFCEGVAELGNARTTTLPQGGMIGIRAPMHESETPVIRPYWLVEDIQLAIKSAVEAGGEVAHPPLEIPGIGTFAIYIQGGNHHGLWQK